MNSRKHCLIFRNAKKNAIRNQNPLWKNTNLFNHVTGRVHKALKLLFLPASISHEKFYGWNFYIQLTSKTYQNG